MALEVRTITAEELEAWVAATQVAFHVDRSAADEAEYRRHVLQQDLERSLAAFDGQRAVGTLWSFSAELSLPGGTSLTADAISAVSVMPTHRRRGLLTRMINRDLEAARERGEPASILIAAEYPIYGRFGFGPSADRADYSLDTPLARFTRRAAGSVDLIAAERMQSLAPGVFDRFRCQRPGQIDRWPTDWERRLGLRQAPWARDTRPPRCALYSGPDGAAEGYALYRVDDHWDSLVPASTLEVSELIAVSDDAYLGLWQFLSEVDLIRQVTANLRCVDEPLRWLLDNPRAALRQTMRTDFLWLRPLDVPATLAARRYLSEGRVVFDVSDPLGMCGGRYVLDGGPDGATCRSTDQSADLALSMQALGAISLGGVSLHLLAETGAIDELRPGALDAGDRLFHWPITPWCSTFF